MTRNAAPRGPRPWTASGIAALATLSFALTGCTGDEAGAADDAGSPAQATSSDTTAPSAPGPTGATDPAVPTPGPTSDAATTSVDDGEAPDGAEAPFVADTSTDTRDHSADAATTVTDVRIGAHDGYERVVLEIEGAGTPGWRSAYVDEAVQDGSGAVLDVAGDTILSVRLSGTGYPFDTGVEEYAGPNPLTVAATRHITEVVVDGTFEGYTQVFVGLDEVHPFRVFLLENPTRVVIDVRED